MLMLKNSCNYSYYSVFVNDNANAMLCFLCVWLEESRESKSKPSQNRKNQCAGWQKQESDLPISTNGGYEPELITLKCTELKVKSRASASKREGGRTRKSEPKIQCLPKQSRIDANQDALVDKKRESYFHFKRGSYPS